MIGNWRAFLLDKAAEWDVPRTGTWKLLFSNNYQQNYSTFALLWFHEGDRFPRVVTKVFRQPQIPSREFDNLQQVYPVASKWAPRPLHFGSQGEFWMLWMEGVPGSPVPAPRQWTPAILRSIVEMLNSVHRAVRRQGEDGDENRYGRLIAGPLQTLAHFGSSPSVRDGCTKLAAQATTGWLDSQAVIPQHGDLVAGNLLSHRRQWHIIDWESFGTIDLPFYDLFTLLLSVLRTRGETPDKWDRSLLKEVPALIECYAMQLGLPRADAALLLPLTLANWFYLHWSDGRTEFTARLYNMIQHYFENPDMWGRSFPSQAGD